MSTENTNESNPPVEIRAIAPKNPDRIFGTEHASREAFVVRVAPADPATNTNREGASGRAIRTEHPTQQPFTPTAPAVSAPSTAPTQTPITTPTAQPKTTSKQE